MINLLKEEEKNMRIWFCLLICAGSIIDGEAAQSLNSKNQATKIPQFELKYFVCEIIIN